MVLGQLLLLAALFLRRQIRSNQLRRLSLLILLSKFNRVQEGLVVISVPFDSIESL